jgi:hypothetical protein
MYAQPFSSSKSDDHVMVLDDMGLEASIEHLMFGSPAENAAKYSRGTPKSTYEKNAISMEQSTRTTYTHGRYDLINEMLQTSELK